MKLKIREQRRILIKAYHECIYQKKMIDKPNLYYRHKLQEVEGKSKPLTREQSLREEELREEFKKYSIENAEYYRKWMDLEEIVLMKIREITIYLEHRLNCINE